MWLILHPRPTAFCCPSLRSCLPPRGRRSTNIAMTSGCAVFVAAHFRASGLFSPTLHFRLFENGINEHHDGHASVFIRRPHVR
jgi:hypothetical protein